MPHSWKSHVTAHIYWHLRNYTHVWACLLTPFLFIFSEMIKTYITSVLLLISLIFAAVTSARFIQDTDERYVYFSLVFKVACVIKHLTYIFLRLATKHSSSVGRVLDSRLRCYKFEFHPQRNFVSLSKLRHDLHDLIFAQPKENVQHKWYK